MAMEILPPFIRRVDSVAADFTSADPACGLHLYREHAAFHVLRVFPDDPTLFVQNLSNLVGIFQLRNSFVFFESASFSLPIEMQLVQRAVRSISLSLGWILRACLRSAGTLFKILRKPQERHHERIQKRC
jgi:hypothetical protein